jgi:hypothetical protein
VLLVVALLMLHLNPQKQSQSVVEVLLIRHMEMSGPDKSSVRLTCMFQWVSGAQPRQEQPFCQGHGTGKLFKSKTETKLL